MIFHSFFFLLQKTGFDISCKLSPERDSLHEMSKPVFRENFQISSAENLTGVLSIKSCNANKDCLAHIMHMKSWMEGVRKFVSIIAFLKFLLESLRCAIFISSRACTTEKKKKL